MANISHSTLLKFFVNTSKMSESSDKTDLTIQSEVPEEQAFRGDYIQELKDENVTENDLAVKDYSISPVIKVTKQESTFTKGDLKFQKVVVSEDISDEKAITNRKLTITESTSPTEVQSEVHRELSSVTINADGVTHTTTGDQTVAYKVTKIPKLKFKQAAEKLKKEEDIKNEIKDEVTAPKVKDDIIFLQESIRSDFIKEDSPKIEDEFDKIYDEILENGPPSGTFPSPGKIEDPINLEIKFDQIIHAYDEQKTQTTNVEKVRSKIPLLKRKSEHDIDVTKQTLTKNSLLKRNSIDEAKYKLPVPLPKEEQNRELQNQSVANQSKPISAKNIAVLETVNTNISTIIQSTSHQKNNERFITKETEFNTKTEVLKSKIPTQLKKINAIEKISDIPNSSQMNEEKSEDSGKNIIDNNETQKSETKINTLNIKTELLKIKDNIEKVPYTDITKNKDITTNTTIEKAINSTKHSTITESLIVIKEDAKNFNLLKNSTENEKSLDATKSDKELHDKTKHSENKISKTEVLNIKVNEIISSIPINQEVNDTVKVIPLQHPNSKTKDIHKLETKHNTSNVKTDISNIKTEPIIITTNVEKAPITVDTKNKDISLITTIESSTNQASKQSTKTETKSLIVTKVIKNFNPLNNSAENEKQLDAMNSDKVFHDTKNHSDNKFSKTEVQSIKVNEINISISTKQDTVKADSLQFPNSETKDIQENKQDKICDNITKKNPNDILIEKRIENSPKNILNKNEIQKPNTKDTINTSNVTSNIKSEAIIITSNVKKLPHTIDTKNKDISLITTIEKSTDKSKQSTETETKSLIVTKEDVKNIKPLNDSTKTERALDATSSNNDFHETNKHSENKISKTEVLNIKVNEINRSISTNQEVSDTVKVVPLQFPNSEIKAIHKPKSIDTINTLDVRDNIINIKTESLKITDNVEKVPYTNDTKNKEITLNKTIKKGIYSSEQSTKTETESLIVCKEDDKNLKPLNDSIQNEKQLVAMNCDKDFNETKKYSENKFSKTEVQSTKVNEINSSILTDQDTIRSVSLQFPKSVTKEIQQNKQDKVSDNITIPNDILIEKRIESNFENISNKSEAQKPETNNIFNTSNLTAHISNNETNPIIITAIAKKIPNITDTKSKDVTMNIKIENTIVNSKQSIKTETKSPIVTQIDDINLKPFNDLTESEKLKNDAHETSTNARSKENYKEIINSTKVNTQLNNAHEQSEAHVQRQEIKEITKKIVLQEHSSKLENISKEINNDDIRTEFKKDNKDFNVIAITDNEINSSENNDKVIEDLEEEDIITLKGKVNRIIKRLDSKELKVIKCELEDVPREVSVVSKIAMFEQSKSIDKTSEALITKIKTDKKIFDKPKIVDSVLKIDNSSIQSDNKFSYDTFLNYKNSIKNNNNLNRNKFPSTSQAKPITRFDKIYSTHINLNNFNKNNEHKVGLLEDEVFSKTEETNRNIINEYKMNKEIDLDMRKAKSMAELNYDGVQGKVRQMVVRMNSIDKMALERREQNEVRKKKRQGSVSERIALFEQDANEPTVYLMKKVTPIRMESVTTTTSTPKPEEFTPTLSEEELAKKIAELTQARATYGQYDNMTYIELSDGGRLPTLTVGTALLDSQLVKPIIKAAIDLGFRAIDTAYIYGNEQAVGEAIREKIQDGTVKREELFVLAKLWSTNHRRDLVARACKQSLDIMGLDYFDLYLIHNPMSFKEGSNPIPKIANVLQYSENDYLDAWFGIEDLIKQGLVKRGGLSNFNSVQVERVIEKGKIKPVVNQVECHPYLSQARLQDYLSSRHMAMSCFGCLGSSGTPRALRSSLPPVIDDPLVRTMAAGLGISPAQLLISYQVFLGRGVVVKASTATHLWDNLRALSLQLEPAHVAALSALNRNKRTFTFEGMGDTHKNYPFKIPF